MTLIHILLNGEYNWIVPFKHRESDNTTWTSAKTFDSCWSMYVYMWHIHQRRKDMTNWLHFPLKDHTHQQMFDPCTSALESPCHSCSGSSMPPILYVPHKWMPQSWLKLTVYSNYFGSLLYDPVDATYTCMWSADIHIPGQMMPLLEHDKANFSDDH